MAKSNLEKRIEKLEGLTGQGVPETKLFLVNQHNYREKEIEIQEAKEAGFYTVVIYGVPAKDGKVDPEFAEYNEYREGKMREKEE